MRVTSSRRFEASGRTEARSHGSGTSAEQGLWDEQIASWTDIWLPGATQDHVSLASPMLVRGGCRWASNSEDRASRHDRARASATSLGAMGSGG